MSYRQYDMLIRLVNSNEYLQTEEERQRAFSAMAAALNWANHIKTSENISRRRYKGADALTRLNHSRYEDK